MFLFFYPFLACYFIPLELRTIHVVCFFFAVQASWIHYDYKTRVKKKEIVILGFINQYDFNISNTISFKKKKLNIVKLYYFF